jgi:FKBP-type peptidyl-prolyl cis-trans isomerase SlpA
VPGSSSSSCAICSTLSGHAGAQHDGQQLGIRERGRTPLRELFARLGIQGQVFDGHQVESSGPALQLQTAAQGAGAWGIFYNAGQFIGTFMTTSATPSTDLPVVQAGSFLTLHYRLAGPARCDQYLQRKAGDAVAGCGLSPAMEDKLIGLAEGTHTTFELPAGEAFGERNPDMMQWVARKLMNELGDPHEQYTAGDVVQFPTPDGQGSYAGAVVQVREDGAVLFDFNHPLAGQPVTFEVKLIGVL